VAVAALATKLSTQSFIAEQSCQYSIAWEQYWDKIFGIHETW